MTDVMIICGSASPESHSLSNAEYAKDIIADLGLSTTIWDLYSSPLPFHQASEHFDIDNSSSATIREFASLAMAAKGFILCTPNYHGSFSGVLKNALDNLTIKHMQKKPVLLIVNGGGRFGSSPCDQLRVTMRSLNSMVTICQIVTQAFDFSIDDKTGKRQLTAPAIIDRFNNGCRELVSLIGSFNYEQLTTSGYR